MKRPESFSDFEDNSGLDISSIYTSHKVNVKHHEHQGENMIRRVETNTAIKAHSDTHWMQQYTPQEPDQQR